ncbi:MAG: hypothetical protein QM811_02620 [Pirellulales bacterium]
MGYDDHDDDDIAAMRAKEKFYLNKVLAVDATPAASDAPTTETQPSPKPHRDANDRRRGGSGGHGGGASGRGRRPRRPRS